MNFIKKILREIPSFLLMLLVILFFAGGIISIPLHIYENYKQRKLVDETLDTIVYVSKYSGECHEVDCEYWPYIAVPIEEALASEREPCNICTPPKNSRVVLLDEWEHTYHSSASHSACNEKIPMLLEDAIEEGYVFGECCLYAEYDILNENLED